jgi:hypothetical protein
VGLNSTLGLCCGGSSHSQIIRVSLARGPGPSKFFDEFEVFSFWVGGCAGILDHSSTRGPFFVGQQMENVHS